MALYCGLPADRFEVLKCPIHTGPGERGYSEKDPKAPKESGLTRRHGASILVPCIVLREQCISSQKVKPSLPYDDLLCAMLD
jgi:hypothetical protein